jgi:hypothetical protein
VIHCKGIDTVTEGIASKKFDCRENNPAKSFAARQHLEFLGVRSLLIALVLTCIYRTQAAIRWRCVLRAIGADDGKCFWTLGCCSILLRGMQRNWNPALRSRTPRMIAVLSLSLAFVNAFRNGICVFFHNHQTGQYFVPEIRSHRPYS